jgi:gliding motility-associated-like protein
MPNCRGRSLLARNSLFVLLITLLSLSAHAQTYVFAQLKGTPINTSGWSLSGAATVGNITGNDNSELILCRNQNNQSGAIFFNQPINLNICSKWVAEFDFRMFDGSQADGLAFCFLDVPPTGFVLGSGMGIPQSANGLKICFDTWLNCTASGTLVPKIEMRWGAGYDECSSMPTVENAGGNLSFLRSNIYNHAKISYNNGNIEVYVNNTLYLSGFQQFNFSGYLGFTASTGGSNDNHSIKNVAIYTDMPPSEAGNDRTVCSGQTVQLGTTSNPGYNYSWTPALNLSENAVSNPSFSLANTTASPVAAKYFVNTSFNSNASCASQDSVTITILPSTAISISSDAVSICAGDIANFTSLLTTAGPSPVLQWKVNNLDVGTHSANFSTSTLKNGDIVTCVLTPNDPCATAATLQSNAIVITVNPVVVPAVSISASANNVCAEQPVSFTAMTTNGGVAPVYAWTVNGISVGANASTFTSTDLKNDDMVQCMLTSNSTCPVPATASSTSITMKVTPLVTPSITITSLPEKICAGGTVNFTASFTNGGTAPGLQWKKNGVSVGTNSISYTDNTVVNGDVISCVLTSDITCATTKTVESSSVVVNVFANPIVSLNRDSVLCIGSPKLLDPGPFSRYLWNNGSTERTLLANSIGIYYIKVTTAEGCIGTDTALIKTALPSPSNFLPRDSAVCAYSRFVLAPLTKYSSYLWSTNSTSDQIEVRQPGTYWLQVTSNNQCVGKDSVVYAVKDCGNEIFYPSAFTPNGDGMNEVFKPLLLNKVDHYKFSVYNRLGQLVFSTTDVTKGWDGTLKGVQQSAQTFIWICTYQFAQQPLRTDKGTIVLLR